MVNFESSTMPQEQKKQEKPRLVVGAKKNPDGTWDLSKAMVIYSREESQEAIEKAKMREAFIAGKLKEQIEANPNAVIDADQARAFWSEMYDEAGPGEKMNMQVNELYAQKYEQLVQAARERIMKLEQQLNTAQTEKEQQAILAQIVEERNAAIAMQEEAKKRRGY